MNKTYDQFVLMGKGANATRAGEVVKSVVTATQELFSLHRLQGPVGFA